MLITGKIDPNSVPKITGFASKLEVTAKGRLG